MEQGAKKGAMLIFLLKLLIFSYFITGILLLVLAMLLYKLHLSEGMVNIGIIVIYVSATFLAGFIAGRKTGQKKYLWGIFLGGGYFLILALISLFINHSVTNLGDSFLTTMFLCVGGGMLGGMVS